MIDSERRKSLALHLRHLSVGMISNDQFEENIFNDVSNGWLPEQYYRSKKAKTDDAVIVPILETIWGLYSDTFQHKLKDIYKLSDESLKIIARCILFLQSDLEFEWPEFKNTNRFTLVDSLLGVATLGYFFRRKRKLLELDFEDYKKIGDYNYWPFFNANDYKRQLKIQPFLTGNK